MVNTKLKLADCFIFLVLFVIFTTSISAQELSRKQTNLYAKKISELKSQNKLTKYFYPNKSCGGALFGWFLKDDLVYFEATDGGYDQEYHYFVYVKNEQILKAVSKFYERNKKDKMIFKETETWYPKSYNPYECGEQMIKDLKREKVLEK